MDAAASGVQRDPGKVESGFPIRITLNKGTRRNVAAYGEIVWSWRRDPGATLAGAISPATGARKAASPGRARISRNTIARGKPGCLGCTCQIRVRSLLPLHTVLRAQSAPGFPCALCQREGQRDVTTRAKTCRGNAVGCLKIESANARSSRPSEARAGTHNHRTRSCEGWDPQPALAT